MNRTTLIIVMALLCFFTEVKAQNKVINIRGKITDEKGTPIPSANIVIKGGKEKAVSNSNGEFDLKNVPLGSTLVITSIGFKKKEILAKNEEHGSIELVNDNTALEEVEVNAGYYTVKDRERTGSISRVSAKTIEKQPVSNPLQALQGRVAGMEITQNTGVPGGGFTVRIRGQNSIANGNDPLYIVDGVPITSTSLSSGIINISITPNASPLSAINPADIESIEVLKDADATAIYGSRGANGVVLITTKKGTAGKTKVTFNVASGKGKVTRMLPLLNTEQYLEMRKEAFSNDNVPLKTTDYDLNGTWDQGRYTNWQKELIGNTSVRNDAHLSISGGSDQTVFLFSTNYNRETTVFPGDNSYQRKNGSLNFNHQSADNEFKIQGSASYSAENSTLPHIDLTGSIMLPPNAPAMLNSDGSINFEKGTFRNNPMSYLARPYESVIKSLIANLSISYRIIHNLEFSTRAGYTSMQRDEVQNTPLSALDPLRNYTAIDRTALFSDNRNQIWNVEPQLTYYTKLASARLNIMAGMTIQQSVRNTQTIAANNFNSDGMMKNIAAAGTIRIRDLSNAIYRYASIYSRVNYNLADKYLINITARRDGSSRFGRDNIYANFGAVGAAWIFSKEKAIEDFLPGLSFGKLRASFGIAGNDQIGDYNYLELWKSTTNPYNSSPGLYPYRIGTPDYSWESTTKKELALEFGFFKDKLRGSIAHFRNRSSNQLVNYILPPSTGFPSIQRNLPATVENTGWEFELSGTYIQKKEFSWSGSINLTVPKNKLVAFPDLDRSSYASLYKIGEPLNILKSLQFIGVDPQSGLYTFTDFDGSGEVSTPGDLQIINRLSQRFYGGLQNQISYKGWELDFIFQFVKQTGYNYITNLGQAPGQLSNQPTVVLDRWQKPGDVKPIQRYTVSASFLPYAYGRAYGDMAISDASFIRLKNLAIAYRFEQRFIKALGISAAKIYLHGQNLITISDFLGLDPESQNFLGLPPLSMVSAGIQVSF